VKHSKVMIDAMRRLRRIIRLREINTDNVALVRQYLETWAIPLLDDMEQGDARRLQEHLYHSWQRREQMDRPAG